MYVVLWVAMFKTINVALTIFSINFISLTCSLSSIFGEISEIENDIQHFNHISIYLIIFILQISSKIKKLFLHLQKDSKKQV